MSNLIDKYYPRFTNILGNNTSLNCNEAMILEIIGIPGKDEPDHSILFSNIVLIPRDNTVSAYSIANSVLVNWFTKEKFEKIQKIFIKPYFSKSDSPQNTVDFVQCKFNKDSKLKESLLKELNNALERWDLFSETNNGVHKEFDNNYGYLVLLCLFIKYVCRISRSYGIYIDNEKEFQGFYNDTDHIYVRRRDFNDFLSWFFGRKMIMKNWVPEFIKENKKYVMETHKIYSATPMFKIHKDFVIKLLEKEFSKEPGYIENNGMSISEYMAKILTIYHEIM